MRINRNLVIVVIGIYIIAGVFVTAAAHLVSAGAQRIVVVPGFFEPVSFMLNLFF